MQKGATWTKAFETQAFSARLVVCTVQQTQRVEIFRADNYAAYAAYWIVSKTALELLYFDIERRGMLPSVICDTHYERGSIPFKIPIFALIIT